MSRWRWEMIHFSPVNTKHSPNVGTILAHLYVADPTLYWHWVNNLVFRDPAMKSQKADSFWFLQRRVAARSLKCKNCASSPPKGERTACVGRRHCIKAGATSPDVAPALIQWFRYAVTNVRSRSHTTTPLRDYRAKQISSNVRCS